MKSDKTSIDRRVLTSAAALAVVAATFAGCSRAGGTPDNPRAGAPQSARPLSVETGDRSLSADDAWRADVVARLERLRARGRFEEFIDGALNAALEYPDHAALQLQKCEALLAAGRADECGETAARAARLASDSGADDLAVQALKMWGAACFRQRRPLDGALLSEVLANLPPDDGSAQILKFWQEALGGRAAYRVEAPAGEPAALEMAQAASGSIPFELSAVQARANGVAMPMVFIDTGAQHTLMTAEAARSAGITVGDSGTQLTGFAGLVARPGLIEILELGNLVLYDVPVLVGDSAPLVANEGQLSLGTELMHHVRFHIDYPARRVTAEPADRASALALAPSLWDIPVWSFSQICLARGQRSDGPMARVLVDTGDRAGTFLSYRWGRRHVPQLRGTNSSMVFRFKKRNLVIEELELGSKSLVDWPVVDTMPSELDRLNLVDVILGHDLVWPYQLTIDLPRRVLQLRPGTAPAVDDGDADMLNVERRGNDETQ